LRTTGERGLIVAHGNRALVRDERLLVGHRSGQLLDPHFVIEGSAR